MIVFRFDDLTTIGNHVRNMPCGSPCRFVISKGGDSSATVVLTSNGTTISATSESIAPFSTDEYVGFDIVTPEESANIPYHAVITGTNEVHDIDLILNCNKQIFCGDAKQIIKITDLDSIGSHSYTVPTNSYIGLEAELDGADVFSFPASAFPSQSNVTSTVSETQPSIQITGIFYKCKQTQILTPNSVGVINAVATVESFEKVEDGVYDSGTTATRFTGYNEDGEAEYLIDVCPKENVSCPRILDGEELIRTSRYVYVIIKDMQENVLASAPFFFSKRVGSRPVYWSYDIDENLVSGNWKDYYPYRVWFFANRGTTEPATPSNAEVLISKQPDGKTTASCAGETKYSFVSKPHKQFDITITTKDTGFSYSK